MARLRAVCFHFCVWPAPCLRPYSLLVASLGTWHLSTTISTAFYLSCSQKWLQLKFEWNFLLSLASVLPLAMGPGQEVGFCRIFWKHYRRLQTQVRSNGIHAAFANVCSIVLLFIVSYVFCTQWDPNSWKASRQFCLIQIMLGMPRIISKLLQ